MGINYFNARPQALVLGYCKALELYAIQFLLLPVTSLRKRLNKLSMESWTKVLRITNNSLVLPPGGIRYDRHTGTRLQTYNVLVIQQGPQPTKQSQQNWLLDLPGICKWCLCTVYLHFQLTLRHIIVCVEQGNSRRVTFSWGGTERTKWWHVNLTGWRGHTENLRLY